MHQFVTDQAELALLMELCKSDNRIVPEDDDEIRCKWFPETVRIPGEEAFFNRSQAFDFAATLIEQGHAVRLVPWKKMPGKFAYQLVVEIEKDQELYVKLALNRRRTQVFGISFHYSIE